MSNEKKNPLIGAFRAPPVGTPPSPTQPAKQPETPKNVKAPATPLSAPIPTKLEESKKTVEPAKDDKAVKDGKPAAAAPTPTKPEESKKPAEPVKADAVKEITVSENTSVSSLAKELDDQGVINYHSVFKLYLTLKHQTDTSVLAGAYQLNPSMDYGQIVDALANTASTETVQITIPEGYSISQIRQVLLDNHICTEDALDEVLNEYSFKHDFLEDEKPAAEGWLEGYLCPDTYEVYKGNAAVVDTINKMLNNFGNKYDADIKSGAENLGRSMHDIVTIASLIEREAQRDDERARIAGVIYNRLNNSSEFPYLQVDASVLYGLGRTGGKLSDEDLKSDSEYNLYNHKGLPPGPICNPGYASLYAASHPEDNNYYYYVAMPDGSHLFASSYEEHERNIEASNQAQAQAASASADTTTTEATGE